MGSFRVPDLKMLHTAPPSILPEDSISMDSVGKL